MVSGENPEQGRTPVSRMKQTVLGMGSQCEWKAGHMDLQREYSERSGTDVIVACSIHIMLDGNAVVVNLHDEQPSREEMPSEILEEAIREMPFLAVVYEAYDAAVSAANAVLEGHFGHGPDVQVSGGREHEDDAVLQVSVPGIGDPRLL